ncbi:MAG: mobile mystery protein A [Deltaproteobacteria bacterium]|nr:mobile mystery protein A [Deltaproteobacteria bacterium]
MSLETLVDKQYRATLDQTVEVGARLRVPPEGWLRTARKALKMSGAQLARRMKVTRALVSRTERAEADGRVTLRTMRRMADAMGYRFVYALVPNGGVENMVWQRALQLARREVATARAHMALEDQVLDVAAQEEQAQRLARELLEGRASRLWEEA